MAAFWNSSGLSLCKSFNAFEDVLEANADRGSA